MPAPSAAQRWRVRQPGRRGRKRRVAVVSASGPAGHGSAIRRTRAGVRLRPGTTVTRGRVGKRKLEIVHATASVVRRVRQPLFGSCRRKTLCRGSFSVVSCMLPAHPHTHLGSAHHAPGNTLHQRLDLARTPHRGSVPVRPPCTGGCFSVPAKLRQIKHLQRNRGPTHYRGKAQPVRLRKSRPETGRAQACARGSFRASTTRFAGGGTGGGPGGATGAPPAGR
jgi:hypothetical protein